MIADTLHASATVEATTRAVQDVTGQGVPTGEASNNVKASMLARSSRVGIGYTASANHSVANTGYVLQPNGAVSRFAGGAVFQFVPLRSGTIAVSPSTIMSMDGRAYGRIEYDLNSAGMRFTPQKLMLHTDARVRLQVSGVAYSGRRVVQIGRGVVFATGTFVVEFRSTSEYYGCTLFVSGTQRGWRRR